MAANNLDDKFRELLDSLKAGIPELELCDRMFDFLRRKTDFLAKPMAEIRIYTKLKGHIAQAKEDFIKSSKEQEKEEEMEVETKPDEENKMEVEPEFEEIDIDLERAKKERREKKAKAETKKKTEMKVEKKEKEKGDESDSEEDNTPAPVGNGGTTDKYVWTQSLEELDMRVEVPASIKGRHCVVDVKSNRLKIAIKGEKECLVEGEFHEEIKDSMWTLETESHEGTTKKFICLNLVKRKGMCWWKRVIVGDPEIKTKKIQPENSKLDDLDGETRQTVEKMMFDQRMKEMGKPTSKEREQRSKLDKFMKMHPEMDFSGAKFGNQGTGNMAGMGNMFGNMGK